MNGEQALQDYGMHTHEKIFSNALDKAHNVLSCARLHGSEMN